MTKCAISHGPQHFFGMLTGNDNTVTSVLDLMLKCSPNFDFKDFTQNSNSSFWCRSKSNGVEFTWSLAMDGAEQAKSAAQTALRDHHYLLHQ